MSARVLVFIICCTAVIGSSSSGANEIEPLVREGYAVVGVAASGASQFVYLRKEQNLYACTFDIRYGAYEELMDTATSTADVRRQRKTSCQPISLDEQARHRLVR